MPESDITNFVSITWKTIEKKNSQIKLLKQKVRRYEKKIKTSEALVKHLQDKNLVFEEAA